MKSVKLAVIAALSSFAVSAFALSPMQDTDLSAVSGQDGVSIAADLNVKIGSFEYTAKNGATFGTGLITVTGAIAATIDVMNNLQFVDLANHTGEAFTILGVTGGAGAAGFAPGASDAVVKIAIPDITTSHKINIAVNDMTVGSTNAVNVGSMKINDLQLQGTTAYIWARKSYQ